MSGGWAWEARQKKDLTPKDEEQKTPKRPGRKRLTPEEKEAAAKARAAEKKKADNLNPELILQYQSGDVNLNALVEAAKANFRAEKKRTRITGMRLYIKPEEGMIYYVVNDKFNGSIPFWICL